MIVYSPDIFYTQTFGGVSRCLVEIATAVRARGADCLLYAGRTSNSYAQELAGDPDWSGRLILQRRDAPIGRIRGSLKCERPFARFVAGKGAAIVHRSYYRVFDMLPRATKVVETLHDMMWECLPHELSRKEQINSYLKYKALARADVIACVSEFTRSELASHWPELADKATVIPHGVRPLSDNPVPAAMGRPYFLYVGAREFRKNFPLAVEAFRQSGLAGDHLFVCAGGGAFNAAEREMFAAAGMADSFRQMQPADDILAGLYAGATALLYPSFYEGFGMPLLEAMIHDCPVIGSNAASLPEVGGTAAMLLDSADSEGWAHAMQRLAADGELRTGMIERGRATAAAHTWERAGASYGEVYARLA